METLGRFIGHLAAAYQRVHDHAPGPPLDAHLLTERRQSLLLAEAAIRHALPGPDRDHRPAQVAVIGPTQTGKTTLVNLLLGYPAGEVSPLAGFTVHPRGFWITARPGSLEWAARLFPGWRQCEPAQLSRDDFEAYSLTQAAPPPVVEGLFEHGESTAATLPPCVVWDTPDFDSLAARQYARGVLEVVALADLYVLVLSKEKYSDLSVWHLLELIEPLRRPLLICVNKLTPDAEETVIRSLRERLAQRGRAWGDVPVVPLPYDAELAAGRGSGPPTLAPRLRAAVQLRLDQATESSGTPGATLRDAGVRSLLRKHWDAWLAPVRAEHDALAEWGRIVQAAGKRFIKVYARDYLDHPQRFDSFRRAAIELLDLLEIPKVGGFVARARRVMTWPARQVIAAGRAWWDDRRPAPDSLHSLGAEAAVLVDTLDALLAGLQRDVVRRCSPATPAQAVWLALERKLRDEQDRLRQVFEAGIRAHHEQVCREIHDAANRLYADLQRQPKRLAVLRTARATIDVGCLLLAVKTGGLTPLDAVFAPATFAVTSLLMESVAGLEMGREARRLKAHQREAVRTDFVRGTLVRELSGLAADLDSAGLFATSTEQLRAATAALVAWEAGDG